MDSIRSDSSKLKARKSKSISIDIVWQDPDFNDGANMQTSDRQDAKIANYLRLLQLFADFTQGHGRIFPALFEKNPEKRTIFIVNIIKGGTMSGYHKYIYNHKARDLKDSFAEAGIQV